MPRKNSTHAVSQSRRIAEYGMPHFSQNSSRRSRFGFVGGGVDRLQIGGQYFFDTNRNVLRVRWMQC